MNTARQILRWAIPGWHLWLFALGFVTVRFVVGGQILTITQLCNLHFGDVLSGLTILAGLGIPMGFVIYQIYFWIYWSLPLPVKTPQDRGYCILKDSNLDFVRVLGYDLDKQAHLEPGKQFRLGPIRVYIKTRTILRRYQHNWLLVDFVWYRCLLLNDAKWLEDRATVLGDIYHALGASLISLWLGFGAYLLYDILMHRQLIGQGQATYLWAGLLNFVLTLLLTIIFRFNRNDTLWSLEALKHDFITYFERYPRDGRIDYRVASVSESQEGTEAQLEGEGRD